MDSSAEKTKSFWSTDRILVLLGLALLLFPYAYMPWALVLFALVGAALFLYGSISANTRGGPYKWLVVTLAVTVIGSAALHVAAITSLDSATPITILGQTSSWGLQTLSNAVPSLALLPLLTLFWLGVFLRQRVNHLLILAAVIVALGAGVFYSNSSGGAGVHNGDENLQSQRLLKIAPISGWGPGGFLRNVNNVRFLNDDAVARATRPRSQYRLVAVDLGIAGLVLVFLVQLWPLATLLRSREATGHLNSRFFVPVSALTIIGCIAANATSLAMLSPQFIWLESAAMAYLVAGSNPFHRRTHSSTILTVGASTLVLLVIVWGSYLTSFGALGYGLSSTNGWTPVNQTGLFPYTAIGGEKMRWTGKQARIELEAPSRILGFKVQTTRYNTDLPEGLRLTIRANGEVLDEVHFFSATSEELFYRLPLSGSRLILETEVSRTFEPRHMGIANSFSDLGVAISDFKFLDSIPQENGIGTYAWRTSADVAGWPESRPMRYRWTRRQASWRLSEGSSGWARFFVRAGHPDITARPVRVAISGNFGILYEFVASDEQWHQVILSPSQIRETREITITVDRTFNPLLSGTGEDRRDLGVAVGEIQFYENLPHEGLGFSDWEPSTQVGSEFRKYRWAGPVAAMTVPRSLGAWASFNFMCPLPGLADNPLRVEIGGDGGDARFIEFRDNEWREVVLSPGEMAGLDAVQIVSDRSWSPADDLGGDDRRRLSIAVTEPRLRVPSDGEDIGFFPWEGGTTENGSPVRFRWTGRAASMSVKPPAGKWARLGLMTVLPDVNTNSFAVDVSSNGKTLRSVRLTDNRWSYVDFSPVELSGVSRIDFSVSRPWSPKTSGLSNDGRILGVGVADIEFYDFGGGESGMFHWEETKDLEGNPKPFRWTGRVASMNVTPQIGKWARIDIMTALPDVAVHPMSVLVFDDQQLLRHLRITDNQWSRIHFSPSEIGGARHLRFAVEKTWIPSAHGVSEDNRPLGVAISEIDFVDFRSEGIWEDFFKTEQPPFQTTEQSRDQPAFWRWSGRTGALINVFNPGDWLMLKSGNPDIHLRPVRVEIFADGKLIREEILIDHNPKRVLLRANELSDARQIRIAVDRTWSPLHENSVRPAREFGVAVAIIPAEKRRDAK